jgi:hypothetical protein
LFRSSLITVYLTSLLYFYFIFSNFITGDDIFAADVWSVYKEFFLASVSERTSSLHLPVCPHVYNQSTILQATRVTFI